MSGLTRSKLKPRWDLRRAPACALARAARLAYRSESWIRAVTTLWGFREVRVFASPLSFAYLAWREDAAVVAFRGTKPAKLQDWLTDAWAVPEPTPWGVGAVHRGFHRSFRTVWPQVAEAVIPLDVPLYLTGHSKGAAEATICARYLVERGHPVAAVYTYGSPRVGDVAFARDYELHLGDRTFRFRNNNDVVTRVPLALPGWLGRLVRRALKLPLIPGGYRHVGRLRYFDAEGRLHTRISAWFRLLDAIDGRLKDLGRLGPDGINDHGIDQYVRLCKRSCQ
ncbi:MAG: lipase family protein [Planctomycetes bacterium]|nr:lipase family protein [Planctomycetota bacterium]